MEQYPRWLLALCFPSLLPLLFSVFFMFGGLTPFGESDWLIIRFALYLLMQLMWVLPVGSFFLSLWLWGRCQERWSICVAVLGLAMTVFDCSLFVVV